MVNWKALPVANRRQFVRFHPADFMAAVQPYSAAVAGSYILALCKYWEAEEEGLADDQEALQKLCRCTDAEWRTVGPVVFGKLLVKDTGGRWRQNHAGLFGILRRVVILHLAKP